MSTDLPQDQEALRLQRLQDLLILDSEPDPVFDSFARLASEVCRTPIATLSLVDDRRQWFKASVGLDGLHETPREISFCQHAIRGADVMEVGDARADPRFAGNPLVTGAPHIRFYAGAPLILPDGTKVGTLCVMDRKPRQLTADQAGLLKMLARTATETATMRATLLQRALAARSRYEQEIAESHALHQALMDNQAEFVSLATPDGRLTYVNRAYAEHVGRAAESMIGANLFDFVQTKDQAQVAERIAHAMATGIPHGGENRMIGADGLEYWTSWTNRRFAGAGGTLLLHSVGRDVTERHRAEQALRDSQALLARTGRVAGVGGWELDLRTQLLKWSEETRRIHEVPADYVPAVGKAVDFYPPDARAAIETAMQAAMDAGQAWDLTLPLLTAAGRKRWIRTLGEADLEGGVPTRLAGTFQDVTEQVAADKALKVLTTIFLNTTDFVVQTDREGNITYMNPAARVACGIGANEALTGRTFSDYCPPDTAQLFAERVLPALKTGDLWLGETSMYLQAQRRVPMSHMVLAHRDPGGRVERFSSVMRDISSDVAAKAAVLQQSSTLRSIIEAIPAIVAVVGPDRRYRFINRSCEQWLGVPRDRIIGSPIEAVLGPAEYQRTCPWIDRVLAGETVSFEKNYADPATPRHLAISFIPLRVDDGAIDGFVSVAQDITEHRQEEVRLLDLSLRDPLTGLLNRSGIEQFVNHRLAEGTGNLLACLCIDLDRFKKVNDDHGHPAGDTLLRAVADRFRASVRPSDAVARLGGDEFAIVLSGIELVGDAHRVAEKIVAAMSEPFTIGPIRLEIGASVGVAWSAEVGPRWADLIERADQLLYQSKRAGRGRYSAALRH